MYAITNHNEDDFVLAGPIEWRPRFFADIISEESNQFVKITEQDKNNVPYFPVQGIKIRKCEIVNEEYDPVLQQLDGPFWTYDENDVAIATYKAVNKSRFIILEDIKNKASGRRWEKENVFLEISLGEKIISINTSKSTREALVSKYISMADDAIVKWKNRDLEWYEFTKPEIQTIISKIDEYIQSLFDEENEIIMRAANVTDHSDYKSILDSLNPVLSDLRRVPN